MTVFGIEGAILIIGAALIGEIDINRALSEPVDASYYDRLGRRNR